MTSKANERRRRDRQFQNEGIEDVLPEEYIRCDCGHWCEKNRVCLHHIERKATEELRYDLAKTIRVCWSCHSEIHTLGDSRWAQKHQYRLLQSCPETYTRIMQLRGSKESHPDIDFDASPSLLSDILT